jgi:predicted nucleotide-binding protein
MYSPPDIEKGNQVKMYNFDEMNTEDFINQLPVRCKKEIIKYTEKVIPKIFIGSSTDGLKYAKAIKSVIENEEITSYHVDLWVDVFGSDNSTNIEVLEKSIDQYKYSIFVFSPDDTIRMSNNDEEKKIPRDNCIFEYGLFMGKNGRPCTFFIVPTDWKGLRIISDTDGMNRFPYTDNENKDSAVRTSCDKIMEAIKTIDIK